MQTLDNSSLQVVVDLMLENPISREVHRAQRMAAASLFSIPADVAGQSYLILRRYLSRAPERFFARDVQRHYLDWLEARHADDPRGLHDYITDNAADLERAFLFLREINVEDWHDTLLDSDSDWEFLRFIDRHVHRVYLRLAEGVLTPFARVPAHFSRRDRSAGTDGLDTYAVVKELEGGPLSLITRSYHHNLRNGLGHGGLTYRQGDITYRDKKGNEATLLVRDVVRLCDDLLDDCNGLAAALVVFLTHRRGTDYPVPEALLVQELAEETEAAWWSIEGAVRSAVPAGSQLLVFARTGTRDFQRIQFSAVQSGIVAEELLPGYDRYFLSLRGHNSTGWFALRGDRLRAHRVSDDDSGAYSDVMESAFFHPIHKGSRLLRGIETATEVIRLHWPAARRQWWAARGIPHIEPRHASVHLNGWHSILRGSVVMEHPVPAIIRNHRRRILRSALSIATASPQRARHYPIGFAQVAVFCRDHRKRRLRSFGLDADLVCTVRYQTISRIRSPDISGATVETAGAWRIAWNRAWLDREHMMLDCRAPWRAYSCRGDV